MKFPDIPFTMTDWSRIPTEEHKGEVGTSLWKIFQAKDVRVRIVSYSPGFISDHWCPRGHILLVLEGEFQIRLKDGRIFDLKPGMGFHVSDDESNPHFGISEKGARVFIVD